MSRLTMFALALGFLTAAGTARADWFSFTPARAQPSAFGMREIHDTDIGVFYKWAGVLARMDADTRIPEPWLDYDLSGLSLRQQAALVNDIVNGYRDVSDEKNWGQSDYWETPAEFFARGGDCEDFAIAKYAWLRWLGVPDGALRLAMVYDRAKRATHMLLIVYANGGTLFLDSQRKDIRSRNDFARYWPLYSVNREGWWVVDAQGKGRKIVQSVLATAAASAH